LFCLSSILSISVVTAATAAAQGRAGVHIYLFAVGMNGANTGGLSLLSGPGVTYDPKGNGYLVTDNNGFFNLTGLYAANCPSPDRPVYLMGVGGSFMGSQQYGVEISALPATCSQLPNLSFVTINDATTVAAAFALAGFADTSDDGFSTTPAGATALADGFAFANSLVSGSTGAVVQGPALTDIDTVSNVISTCFLSAGGAACPQLMSYTTVAGRPAPANVWEAALSMAINPTNNVQNLFNLISTAPNQPSYSSAPATWQLNLSNVPLITSVSPDANPSVIDVLGSANGADYSQFIVVIGGVVADVAWIGDGGFAMYLPAGAAGAAVQVFGPGYASNPYAQPWMPTSITTTLSPTQSVLGSSFNVTATVNSSSGFPVPVGSVTCSVSGQDQQIVPLSPAQNVSTATFTFSSNIAGALPVTCTYPGTALYQSASNNPATATEQVTSPQVATTTAVTPTSPQAYAGTTAVETITVSDSTNTYPDGTVICTASGTSQTFTGTLVNGSATWGITGLPIGTYGLTCSYSGSSAFTSSTSSTVQQQVIATPQPTWTQNGSMSTPRAGHAAVLLTNGKVLLAGGINNTPFCNGGTCIPFTTQSSAEIYDPVAHTVSPAGNSMQVAREAPTATVLNSGLVLIAGGNHGRFLGSIPVSSPTQTADLFDPSSNTFSSTGNMHFARCGGTATKLLDGRVLIVGGAANEPAEIYDPGQGTFSTTGTPVTSRIIGLTATLLRDGKVLFTGGTTNLGCEWNPSQVNPQDIVANAEIFDPAMGTFSAAANMNVSRMEHTATLLNNGKVLIVGGTSDLQNGLASAEIYDPVQNTFTLSNGTLNSARAGHTASVLANGLVLVAGGSNPVAGNGGAFTDLNSAELYTPATDSFQTTLSMASSRQLPSAVVLADGSLLESGGASASGALSGMESYAPPTVSGWINPKYVIVGVTYAPPGGAASTASYANSVTQGNTTTISDSFSNDVGLSVSVKESLDVKGFILLPSGSISVTASSSTDYTQGSMSSNAVTLTKQATLSLATPGVPDTLNPVNHDYDVIWLWLNPLALFTVDPSQPNALVWNGYGFDPNDLPQQDIYPVEVGMLNGDIPMDPSVARVLSRSWATNQIWPAGEGPALTQQDYLNIVQADPFANCSFNNATESFTSCYFPENNTAGNNFGPPPPTNSADGRFTVVGSQPIPYSVNGQRVQYLQSTTNTTQNTQQTSHSIKQAWSLDVNFTSKTSLLFFDATLETDTKYSQSLTWTHSYQQALTNTTMNTSTITIVPPACTPSCPQYTGPGEFLIYQDNLYGTFMLYPVN
jgi:hypothetical protein